MKPSAVNTNDADYSAVPNPDVASPDLNNLAASPDPNPRDSYLSPEGTNTPILGRDSMYMPAPSLISRDSTHESLLRSSSPGTNRNSWASGAALAGDVSFLLARDRFG
jgi:glucan 1,3-beta-glucosidase